MKKSILLVVVLALIFTCIGAKWKSERQIQIEQIRGEIVKHTNKSGIPVNVFRAIVQYESRTYHRTNGNIVTGADGEIGAAQLMPYHEKDGKPLTNLCHNIEAGVGFFSWLIKRYDGNIDHALEAYNKGVRGRTLKKNQRAIVKYRRGVYRTMARLRPI